MPRSRLSPVKRVHGLRGLVNLGNTCYMNAVIQGLLCVSLLDDSIQQNCDKNPEESPITSACKILFEDLLRMRDSSEYRPEYFVMVISAEWTGRNIHAQQDAQEFFSYILNSLHTESLERHEYPPPPVPQGDVQPFVAECWRRSEKSKYSEIFYLQLLRMLKCYSKGCPFESVKSDVASVLTLYLPLKAKCSLKDCLEDYFKETIPQFTVCSSCKSVESTKSVVLLGRLPPILVIQLSRFAQNVNGAQVKNCADVQFDHLLDLTEYTCTELQSNAKYKLFSVTVHSGSTLTNGHFTAYCKRAGSNWFYADDERVNGVTTRRALAGSAYLLWYHLLLDENENYTLDNDVFNLVKNYKFPMYEPLHIEMPQELPENLLHSTTPPSVPEIDKPENIPLSPKPSSPSQSDGPENLQLSPKPSSPQPPDVQPEALDTPFVNDVPSVPSLPPSWSGDLEISEIPTWPDHLQSNSSPMPGNATDNNKLPSFNALSIAEQINSVNSKSSVKTPQGAAKEYCKHPPLNLDDIDPLLTEGDVEGAVMDMTEIHRLSVPTLERLLKTRRLPVTGNRQDLVNRLKGHVAMGKGSRIYPGVDGGVPHERKRRERIQELSLEGDPLPLLPAGLKVWQPFPSCHIPEDFKYWSIVEYYENIPSCTYSTKKGVLHSRDAAPILHEDSDSDAMPNTDKQEETEANSMPGKKQTFHLLCRKAVIKCIEKGEQFLKSGRILTVLDAQRDKHYFLKAQVQASMEQTIYAVSITIESSSGKICSANCGCKTRELHRCGHIAAVLLLVWQHVSTEGYEAITTTGRTCYWRKVAPGRDPGEVSTKQYPFHRDVKRRNSRDPRATAFAGTDPISLQRLSEFKSDLLQDCPGFIALMHIEHHIKKGTDDCIGDLPAEDILKAIDECSRILWKMKRDCAGHDGPFEVPGTRKQANCELWHVIHTQLSTASDSKTFLGLTSDEAKMKYLRRKLWRKDLYTSKAMIEGKMREESSRLAYEAQLQKDEPSFTIEKTGLWRNPKFHQLACSPDGFIKSPKLIATILYETKWYSKPYVNPANFEEELTKEELKRFYWYKDENSCFRLKENHSYNYQIQMSLDILEMEWCHLHVVTESGSVVAVVQYDPTFWTEKRARLMKKHRELIVPELVLKRTLRHQQPVELIYPEFHEDMNDDYFLEED